MDHFNYFVSIYALGKVVKKKRFESDCCFFLSFVFKYMHTIFFKYEKKPFRLEWSNWLKCLCYQP